MPILRARYLYLVMVVALAATEKNYKKEKTMALSRARNAVLAIPV